MLLAILAQIILTHVTLRQEAGGALWVSAAVCTCRVVVDTEFAGMQTKLQFGDILLTLYELKESHQNTCLLVFSPFSAYFYPPPPMDEGLLIV